MVRGGGTIYVEQAMSFQPTSSLQMVFDPNWQSTLNLTAGVSPHLAGTLDLEFALGTNLAALVGDKFQLFDWNGQLAAGQHFDQITTQPGVVWDTSHLYTDGYVTLTAVPEPATLGLATAGALIGLMFRGRRLRRARRREECEAAVALAGRQGGRRI